MLHGMMDIYDPDKSTQTYCERKATSERMHVCMHTYVLIIERTVRRFRLFAGVGDKPGGGDVVAMIDGRHSVIDQSSCENVLQRQKEEDQSCSRSMI